MTRRCSVMRMPVAAQRASIPVFLCAGGDFSTGMDEPWVSGLGEQSRACSAIGRILRQVGPNQKCIQLLPAGLPIIALAAANDAESGPFIQPVRRLIGFFDLPV